MTTLKMEAFAPMASASVATTVSVKAGVRARLRAECLKSLIHDSTVFTATSLIHRGALRPAASPPMTRGEADDYRVCEKTPPSTTGLTNALSVVGMVV